ncbi:OmpP1/FadL family transporter [Dysgonomonas sp. 25]|uniref:OmpP1/FadL family transporter n=1 Tax=Dysgonomonas sp. 25 TaxID=2302933 RepID=UPI0013D6C056|nr:outer membrane protein transport protein [Dysgonomonas sp. 25]NDV67865.1 hypothetical protein [Dysgonomonas sp. 25]
MKRRLIVALSLILSTGAIYAQGEMDAYRFSQNELRGTARSVAMGGAFGALGGDISGVAINPAGIGIYKSSEIVTTLNFQNTKVKNNNPYGDSFNKSKFKFEFDNLAFVTTFDLDSDVAPRFNVGFSYNKLKSFDRQYQTNGYKAPSSLSDYMAYRADGYTPSQLTSGNRWGCDWLAVQGYNAYLIEHLGNEYYGSNMIAYDLNNDLYVKEKGSISSYDFNFGTTFADMFSVGMTVSVTDIDYRMYSSYIEDFYVGSVKPEDFFEQINHMKTEGSGWQLGLGMIFKPINELRIGAAYHSPTWYKMTDYYISDINHDLVGIAGMPAGYQSDYFKSDEGVYDYKLYTPDRWTFSVAGVIGTMAIISLDYELTNYKNMKLKDRGNYRSIAESGTNEFIKQDFKAASTIRAGIEIKPIPQMSFRAGYAFMESPLKKEFRNNEKEVMVAAPIAHYTLDGHTHHYTWGLGYRFSKNFYTDVAFVYKTQNAQLHNMPTTTNPRISDGKDGYGNFIYGDRTDMKIETMQGLLTLGFRF